MGKRSTWTSKDDDQLRALAASGENSAAIAVRLNRTAAGVRRRAMDLGVKLVGSKRELDATSFFRQNWPTIELMARESLASTTDGREINLTMPSAEPR